MLSPSQARAQDDAVAEVFEFMRKHKLSMADLIEIGGEDPRSKNPGRAGKARAVSKCWELIARQNLNFAALEIHAQENFPHGSGQHTALTTPIRRGRKSKPQSFQQHKKSEADAEEH